MRRRNRRAEAARVPAGDAPATRLGGAEARRAAIVRRNRGGAARKQRDAADRCLHRFRLRAAFGHAARTVPSRQAIARNGVTNERRFYEAPAVDGRRSAPAALRNREPIAEVLAEWLPESGLVLEIASGTGEQ